MRERAAAANSEKKKQRRRPSHPRAFSLFVGRLPFNQSPVMVRGSHARQAQPRAGRPQSRGRGPAPNPPRSAPGGRPVATRFLPPAPSLSSSSSPLTQAPKVQQSKEAKALAAANSSKGKKKVRASEKKERGGAGCFGGAHRRLCPRCAAAPARVNAQVESLIAACAAIGCEGGARGAPALKCAGPNVFFGPPPPNPPSPPGCPSLPPFRRACQIRGLTPVPTPPPQTKNNRNGPRAR